MQDPPASRPPDGRTPTGEPIWVPSQHWRDLLEKDLVVVCGNAGARKEERRRILLPYLSDEIRVDLDDRSMARRSGSGQWKTLQDPFLELIVLVYLAGAVANGISGDLVTVRELKEGHFFQGPHALDTQGLEKRFGRNLPAFQTAAEKLGGAPVQMAEAAYRLLPFPKVPLYYLLWEGDDEFAPRVSILCDRSIERHLSADGVWGLINGVTQELLSVG